MKKFKPSSASRNKWQLPFLSLLCFTCATAAPTAVEITDLGTLGGEWSEAYAINDSDQVVGISHTGDGFAHPFLYGNQRMTDLHPLNSQLSNPIGINNSGQVASQVVAENGISYPAIYNRQTGVITITGSLGGVNSDGLAGTATAINNSGQVVGYSYVPSGEWHAFLYDKGGIMRDIGCLPNEADPCYAYALGINDLGQVVGGTGSNHAFLYSNGQMMKIEPADSSGGRAYGINNSGQIAGYFYKGDVGRGFLYSAGTFTEIGVADSPYTAAFGINDSGQVIGSTWVPDLDSCKTCVRPRAFIFENGVLTDLNTLLPPNSEWTLVYAYGINNNGKIVGQGRINGRPHAFLLQLNAESRVSAQTRPSFGRRP